MESNNLEGRSRGSSFRRRALTLVGASALTLSGLGAAVFGASQAFAFSNIQSNPYSIGTVVSGGLSFTATNTQESTTGVEYTLTFTLPSGVSGTTMSLTGLPGITTSTTSTLITAGGVTTPETNSATVGTNTVTSATPSLSAGESVTVNVFQMTNSALTGNPYTIVASVGGSTAATTQFNLTSGPSGPSVTVSPTTTGYAGSTTTFSGFAPSTGLPSNTVYLAVSGGITFPATTTAPVSGIPADYAVTYSTSGSTVQTAASVTGATAPATVGTGSYVTLTLGTILAAGDTVNVTVTGTTNATSVTNPYYGALTVGSTAPAAAPTSGPSFSIGSSMGAVSLTVSPNVAGAANAIYALSFTVPSGVTTTTTESLSATFTDNNGNPVTANAGYAVFDSTNPAINYSSATGGATVTLTGVASGDSVTVDYYGVTNSTATSVTGTVSLTTATVPVKTNTVTYGAASTTSSAVNVSVSNPIVSGSATYTVSGLLAGGTGVNNASSTIILDFSTGTVTSTAQTGLVLPGTTVNYTLSDLTNSGSSGIASVSAGSGGVTITTKNPITAGDQLEITITGVQNPSVAATNYYVTADGTGTLPLTTGAVVPTAAPNAATTGSNGALVNVAGTIYVYAGGVAFGIPTPAVFNSISAELGNPTVVAASSVTTSGTVSNGTLLQAVGSPEIGVVSGGTYYGFMTASQFTSEGYSWGRVIQVPSLAGLTMGTGTPPNAAATASDGSLVNVSGTIYVYAGGVAVGIPTPAVFSMISAELGNPAVVTASSVTTTGNMATGTLVQVAGSPQINVVTTGGVQVGFSTASQFTSDGYSFARVIMIP